MTAIAIATVTAMTIVANGIQTLGMPGYLRPGILLPDKNTTPRGNRC